MAELSEFVEAQAAVWGDVIAELRAGRKTTHWIWWVFPQLETLGRSTRARHFGLSGVEEASAYLAHPVLGPRLAEASALLLSHAGTPPETILGSVDALKVRSSMTLFEATKAPPPEVPEVLRQVYGGVRCSHTRDAIRGSATG
ncbi:DUF1810 domain-containing protein [Roseivivax sediminis]|uniref:Uncharacterized protein, DUF1810 family n=1 Tax=Roseivivax sediminis TaxID=936889 RepID=A0A1I1UI35_9RHOB|nr:DUF1810 domain-containing protein [Roseivivax sediminis]SFD69268.1 Uncharacterized protein, DUF1810 family [Roseivivax sediminis]